MRRVVWLRVVSAVLLAAVALLVPQSRPLLPDGSFGSAAEGQAFANSMPGGPLDPSAPGVARSVAGQRHPVIPVAPKDYPKLESSLATVARTLRDQGEAAARDAARALVGIASPDGGTLKVLITPLPGREREVSAAVQAAGGRTIRVYEDVVQAEVPLAALATLDTHPAVQFVRPNTPLLPPPPPPVRPAAPGRAPRAGALAQGVGGEALEITNAAAWHAAGFRGQGVKVAVIDSGFSGLNEAIASGDLPSNVVQMNYCASGMAGNTYHGTGVAEIVHDMAPDAQLYLACTDDVPGARQAKDDLIAMGGISIVNHSRNNYYGRGDGSGDPTTFAGIAADARTRGGILWVNSAGNSADGQHWHGLFNDPESDGWHNWSGPAELNPLTLEHNQFVWIDLRWDAWPTTNIDFDLYVVRASDQLIVGGSTTVQDGTQPPYESIRAQFVGPTDQYAVLVYRKPGSAPGSPRIDVFTADLRPLEFFTAGGSISEPAPSPLVFAVGAACWQNERFETYSGQGPTIDGRIKPDIAGQVHQSTTTFGPFVSCPADANGVGGMGGTSSASPWVAGAAALVKGRYPQFTAADIEAFLRARVFDRGAPGPDNQFGAGTLRLGPLEQYPLTVTKAGTGTGTVTSAPAGIDCGNDCAEVYTVNTLVALTAAPAGGSTFTGWGGACSGSGPCQVTMDAAKAVTATFNPIPPSSYPLTVTKTGSGMGTVTSAPGGIDCGADCSENYPYNTLVTLTAVPAPGPGPNVSTFAGWGGGCSGTGPCQVTMDAAKTVTARFERVTAGVQVGRPPGIGPSGDPSLEARLTARASCGPIGSIRFGEPGRPFDNARVTITAPGGGPADQTGGFAYTPPPGTTSVTLTIRRVVPSGGATVNPIVLVDGCGEWPTFVGGGPNAFR